METLGVTIGVIEMVKLLLVAICPFAQGAFDESTHDNTSPCTSELDE